MPSEDDEQCFEGPDEAEPVEGKSSSLATVPFSVTPHEVLAVSQESVQQAIELREPTYTRQLARALETASRPMVPEAGVASQLARALEAASRPMIHEAGVASQLARALETASRPMIPEAGVASQLARALETASRPVIHEQGIASQLARALETASRPMIHEHGVTSQIARAQEIASRPMVPDFGVANQLTQAWQIASRPMVHDFGVANQLTQAWQIASRPMVYDFGVANQLTQAWQIASRPMVHEYGVANQLTQAWENAKKYVQPPLQLLGQLSQTWLSLASNFSVIANEFLEGAEQFSRSMVQAHARLQTSLEHLNTLSDYGWTVPGGNDWSLYDLILLSECKTPDEVDAFFLNWFTENDPELKTMEARLCQHARLAQHRILLRQCFSAISRREYAIAVQTLFPALEFVLRQFAKPEHYRSTNIIKLMGQLDCRQSLLSGSLKSSLVGFTKIRYEQFHDETQLPKGQRHAHLHGFVSPKDEFVECLKLLQAISTALDIHDESDVEPEIYLIN